MLSRSSKLKRTGFKPRPYSDGTWIKRKPLLRTKPVAAPKPKKRLVARPDARLAAWGRRVKKRDGFRCKWPACEFCHNQQGVTLDPHHKALRSARPDLRYTDENGVTICRQRHGSVHGAGRDEAVAAGFLDLTTYEAAMKEQAA